jgi:hypothetical protein
MRHARQRHFTRDGNEREGTLALPDPEMQQDPHAVTRQARRRPGVELLEDGDQSFPDVMDEGRGDGGLGVVELVVKGAEAGADLSEVSLCKM